MGGIIGGPVSPKEPKNDLYDQWKPVCPENGDVVLIPVDDSQHAEKAFHWYTDHMHKPSNIVRLLYCADMNFTTLLDLKAKCFEDELDDKKRTSEFLVEKYYKLLEDTGVEGSVQSFVGIPGEVILDHAIRTNTSYIVMGSRGFGLLRRTILGSVSEFVVKHSKVPVTIIPKDQ